ncbi:hypothetical protein ACLOJK_038483 [Asimina triloba]
MPEGEETLDERYELLSPRKGLTILDDEEERLARQEEVDLQVGLTLSCEEARHSGLVIMSPEVVMELVHSGLSSLFVPVMDLDEGALSPTPFYEKEPS